MSKLVFEQIPLGGNRNFGYIVGDSARGVAALVDPAFIPDDMVDRAESLGLRVEWVLITHGHTDHTNGIGRVCERLPAVRVAAHPAAWPTADVELKGGERLSIGDVPVDVLFTPGHHPGSVCFLVAGAKLISGDELFVGKVGGTDFAGSDARSQHQSLFNVLMRLDDSIEVWPGHDFGTRPSSTIEAERRDNPFLQRRDFADFQWLKDNWAMYKRDHGIT